MNIEDLFEGLTANQIDIVDYWRGRLDACGTVTRAMIDPGRLRAHLSALAILDVDGTEPVFRLVGSRLREIAGGEVRGLKLGDLPHDAAQAWSTGLDTVRRTRAPIGGLMTQGRQVHAWLRLPLFSPSGQVAQILCHDEVLSGAALRRQTAIGDAPIPALQTAEAA